MDLKISGIRIETENCKTFFFQANEMPVYKAGQFITFLFENNGKEIRRSYSLSSTPAVDNFLSITVKRESNGLMSRWWIDKATVGDTLTALEPAGRFTIEAQDTLRDIFLAAAGSGIVPIYSIIKDLLLREPASLVHLLYSNSEPASTIFIKELQSMEQRFASSLRIQWFFSNQKNLSKARLSTYSLQAIVTSELQYDLKRAIMYTCGPYDYMMMVQVTSLSLGFLKMNVRKELFEAHETVVEKKTYYDTTDRTMTIIVNGVRYELVVAYRQTILQAALSHGITIPYSCRAGKCSTCICKVLAGRVWMHNNEVLTEADEAMGYSLTCTGHPASDGVVITIN
ncbi:MAG: iron-sulfur cluster-binding domain-containing protein [Bacteroidota bacterium]